MEGKMIEELKRKLENGEISQELYEEIMRRWNHDDTSTAPTDETTNEDDRVREGDTRISGSGHLSNVVSETFRISGSGHVSGYVDVREMKVSGSGKFQGDISVSETLESSGSLKAEKKIVAGNIDSSGSIRAQSIEAKHIDSSGSLRVDQSITGEEMDVSGSCTAESITVDKLESSGSLHVKELKGKDVEITGSFEAETVECENFDMSMDSFSHRNSIKKLIAKNVKIKNRRWRSRSSIEIDEMVCENANLESVKAKSVKGDEVIIGDGCEIDHVEARIIKTSGDALIRDKKIIQ